MRGEGDDNKDGQEAGVLEALPMDRAMAVTFSHISCWVRKTAEPPSLIARAKRIGKAQDEQPLRQILFNISGSVMPGEVLALMGPSGSGKTTLLSILGGRTPGGARQAGAVLFNGGQLSKRTKRQVGYVMQDDLLYETLTVHETLYFAAMLRLPSHMTRAQKLDRVDGVIASLGLRRCRDTIIGGFFRRGVSGGERKRVSVGHELLVNPSLLLLDEPTSGLDSTTAMHLLRLLSRLAGGGRAVVTTIHQPSSRLYHQLDKVLLLSQGRAAYYGAAAAAGEWCAQLGHPVPFGTNLADWLLDLSSGEVEAPGGGGKGGEGPEAEARGEEERGRLVATAEAFLRAHPDGFAQGMGVDKVDKVDAAAAAGDDGGAESLGSRASSAAEGPPAAVVAVGGLRALLGRKTHAAAAADADLESGGGGGGGGGRGRAVLRSQTTLAAARPGASRWGASYGTQLRILFVRAVRVRRFESLAAQDVAQFSIVGLVAGMIWWQVGKGQTLASAQDTLGLLFFEALFLGFRSLFSALFTFPQERKMMLKERASGMYRLSAFYLARTASDLPIEFASPSILVIVCYLFAGLRPGLSFFANFFACLLSTLVAQSFGLLVGACVMVAKTAQTVAAVLMLTFMLVGGFYVKNIPAWIAWLKYGSFLTYSFNLLSKIQFGGQTYYDCDGVGPPPGGAALVPSLDCPPVADLQAALKLGADPNGPPWEVGVLLGFLVVFRALVYVALRVKTAPNGPSQRAR